MPLKLKSVVGDAIHPQDAYQGMPSFTLITQVPEIRKEIDVELANILFVGALAYWTFVDFSSSLIDLKSFIKPFLCTFDTRGIDLNSISNQNRWSTTYDNLFPAITAYESMLQPSMVVGERLKILKRVLEIKLALPKKSVELAEYKRDNLVTVGDYFRLVTDGINEEYVIGGENVKSYCRNADFNAFLDSFVARKKVKVARQTKRKSKYREQVVDSELSDQDDVGGDGSNPDDLRGKSVASLLESGDDETEETIRKKKKREKKAAKLAKNAEKNNKVGKEGREE